MRRKWVALLLTLAAGRAESQAVRISGTSWLQSIDLRPLRVDSVLASTTTGEGEIRRTVDGRRVVCVSGDTWCGFRTSGARETTRPMLHDIGIAAWGLGEGVSVHAHARVRNALGGGSAAWPRLDDRFDVLEGYVEVDRPRWRGRLGRLWSLGGLGAYNYDGGALTLRRGALDGDVFGGRALVQGLAEPYTSTEIPAVDDLPPDDAAWLVGARVRARSSSGAAVSATYLRVIQDDRSGLYAERASIDGSARTMGVRFAANLAYDVASDVVNEGRLRASRTVAGIDVSLEARRHRPFFELWTIWGAFAPVGFDEARASVAWRASDAVSLSASGARRRYAETNVGLQSLPLRNDGWRAGADVTWMPDDHVSARATWDVDIGFGSSQSDGTAGVSWRSDSWEAGATASALQTIYEFRVGTGRIVGVAAHGGRRLTSDLRARGDVGVYHHRLSDEAPGTDWSQRRASVRLEWAIGADPGAGR